MRPRFPARLLALLLVLLPVLGLLAGCTGDDSGDDAGSGSGSSSGLPSESDLEAYFEAVATHDADGLRAAQEIAADGSAAQRYAAYIGEFGASASAAGQPIEPAEVETVDGGFKACVGSDRCVTWADLQGQDGRLTDFTVSGAKLDDALVDLTGQAPIESPGLYRVQPDYAYLSPQTGSLFVLVTVTATDVPLEPKPGLYIEQDQVLKGTKSRSPTTIEAGTSTPVILAFPDAQNPALDGQITFDLGIGDKSTEPIGFGLADPAG